MAISYRIEKTRAIFTPENLVRLKDVSDNFYAELDADFDGFRGHTLISQYAFSEPWPTWEIHPMGDELVMLLSGATDMVLWLNGTEDVIRVNEPGQYVIVPRGTWHTARPCEPTSMLFLTPGEGTLNALEPNGEPV